MRVARAGERFLEVGRRVTAADDPQHEQAATAGESEHRLYAVAAWQEAPFFDDKERAALALTDSVTLIAEQHVPATCGRRRACISSRTNSLSSVWAITVINAWNRIAITTRMRPAA